jgi:hypothetical protein
VDAVVGGEPEDDRPGDARAAGDAEDQHDRGGRCGDGAPGAM